MLSVAFRRQALADLEGISNYISEFHAAAAARVLQRIHHSIYTTLATIPTAGPLEHRLAEAGGAITQRHSHEDPGRLRRYDDGGQVQPCDVALV